jgi:hypothetical protein
MSQLIAVLLAVMSEASIMYKKQCCFVQALGKAILLKKIHFFLLIAFAFLRF